MQDELKLDKPVEFIGLRQPATTYPVYIDLSFADRIQAKLDNTLPQQYVLVGDIQGDYLRLINWKGEEVRIQFR